MTNITLGMKFHGKIHEKSWFHEIFLIFYRKQELRELKLLQKQEQKQFQDLAFKNQLCKEQQDKR